nr:TetR/AcrR family transcriptional regulator C-terminal domain-containing protein [Streptomyces narbonensis]
MAARVEAEPILLAGRFPRLRSRIETTAAADSAEAPDDTFAFGLAALLDGLERQHLDPER